MSDVKQAAARGGAMSQLRQFIYEQCLAAIAGEDNAEKIRAWRILRLMVAEDIKEDSSALVAVAKAIAEKP